MEKVIVLPSRPVDERLARRRGEILRLSKAVEAVLRPVAIRRWPDGGWGLALTVYDRIFDDDDGCGGHWALYWASVSPAVHVVESYAISPLFATDDTAARFVIDGERTVCTDDALPEMLADALAQTRPLRQVTPMLWPLAPEGTSPWRAARGRQASRASGLRIVNAAAYPASC